MPEKEQQFLKGDEVSEKKGGGGQKAEMPIVETILGEEEKTPLGEKTKAIKGYIEQNHQEFPPSLRHLFLLLDNKEAQAKQKTEIRDFFLKLSSDELEKIIDENGLALLHKVLAEQEVLLGQLAKYNLKEKELRRFKEQNDGMLPDSIDDTLAALSNVRTSLNFFLVNEWDIATRPAGSSRPTGQERTEGLRHDLLILRRTNREWQAYDDFERERIREPIEIDSRFMELDLPDIKIMEMIQRALAVLPEKASSSVIKKIRYDHHQPSKVVSYGLGETVAYFSRTFESDGEAADIIFYKTSDNSGDRAHRKHWIANFLFTLAHEWGHSLDPRCINRMDLNPGEQLELIMEWERVRLDEEEWSSYAKDIRDPDRKLQILFQSKESFADSVAQFLNNPFALQHSSPRRYEFFNKWIKRVFPGFDLEETIAAVKNYHDAWLYPNSEK